VPTLVCPKCRRPNTTPDPRVEQWWFTCDHCGLDLTAFVPPPTPPVPSPDPADEPADEPVFVYPRPRE
jgi:hypothetical protein